LLCEEDEILKSCGAAAFGNGFSPTFVQFIAMLFLLQLYVGRWLEFKYILGEK